MFIYIPTHQTLKIWPLLYCKINLTSSCPFFFLPCRSQFPERQSFKSQFWGKASGVDFTHQARPSALGSPRSPPLSTAPRPGSHSSHPGPWCLRGRDEASLFHRLHLLHLLLLRGQGRRPPNWRRTGRNGRGSSGRPQGPGRSAPRGGPARRACACAGTRWPSLCRSWGWWLRPPYSRWTSPRPDWRRYKKVEKSM